MKVSVNKAKITLLGNRRRGYTLPTNNKLYPAQWNWDSAFIALGYSYFNLNFALKEINTLFLCYEIKYAGPFHPSIVHLTMYLFLLMQSLN